MNVRSVTIPYKSTHAFSSLLEDYVSESKQLEPFIAAWPTLEGVQQAINARNNFRTDRDLLVETLKRQHHGKELHVKQESNLGRLANSNVYTVVTAHQPNIFTGPLYVIYKILHTIRLAEEFEKQFPGCGFVPVYYMGSEDADLDELGHIWVDEDKLVWNTSQSGAVGRMKTTGLDAIINRLGGQFSHLPYGAEMISLIEEAYLKHANIQDATQYLINQLFGRFGLLVIIPDDGLLKKAFEPVTRRELLEGFSAKAVAKTIDDLGKQYKIQAAGRDLNLFYLSDNGQRERIERESDKFFVKALDLTFTQDEILNELNQHPQRFSGNVVLRGLFQETVLPNVAFVGGGGEIAYWLELKALFEEAKVPFPVLVVRNSFLIAEERPAALLNKLGLSAQQLFLQQHQQLNLLAQRNGHDLELAKKAGSEITSVFEALQRAVAETDVTLQPHVAAGHARTLKFMHNLQQKIDRAARKKMLTEQRQLETLNRLLFPGGGLQERSQNILPFYAKYGPALIDKLYEKTLALQQQFTYIELV